MKIACFIGDQAHQKFLVQKIAEIHPLSFCIISANQNIRRSMAQKFVILKNRILGRLIARPYIYAWNRVIKTFSERLNLRNTILTLEVPEINSEKTFEWVQKHRPDLIIVSGTNLMNKNLINEIKAYSGKIINLHTGLSPYINGGPNSTNWCLALNRFEWIGNTVMSLDAGIDSGPILATERVNLSGTENLYELQMKVLESAQSLYLKVIRKILDGKNIEGVQQKNIARGQTFYTRAWTPFQMIRGLRNFKRYYTTSYFESETFKKCCSQVTTISIESESMGEKDNGLPSM